MQCLHQINFSLRMRPVALNQLNNHCIDSGTSLPPLLPQHLTQSNPSLHHPTAKIAAPASAAAVEMRWMLMDSKPRTTPVVHVASMFASVAPSAT